MLDREHHGRSLLLERRWDEARVHFHDDAQAGDARAQVEYARMLLHGLGGPADPVQAIDWLERAEAAGHAEAGYYLACIALDDTPGERDTRINERILKAARAGLAPALRAVALHLARRDDPVEQAACVQLLERAAVAGDAIAAPLLAERLYRGEGTPVRLADSRRWWRALANCGVPRLPWLKPWTLPALPAVRGSEDDHVRLAFGDALRPPPWTALCGRPRVMRLPRLLSTDECRMLMVIGQLQMATAHADGPEARFEQALDDFAVRWLHLLMARAARIRFGQTSSLVVQRHDAGEPARTLITGGPTLSHRGPPGVAAPEGRRALCVLLAPALVGGALEISGVAKPIALAPGEAVLFDATPDDGPPTPDASLQVQPVREGTLWLAMLWFR